MPRVPVTGAGAALVARCGAVIAVHPRHRALLAFVAGLLVAPLWRAVAIPTAVLAAVIVGIASRRPESAVLAAAAVLCGGVVATVRLAALENGALPVLVGRGLVTDATLLEPVRERAFGSAVARVRLLDGSVRGEQAVLRFSPGTLPGAAPHVGEILRVRGRVAALGRWDAYQHRRGALAALEVDVVQRTGRRRGGAAGALDAARRRAEAGIDRALAPPEAALLRGMVLGEDEWLTDDVRTDFQRSGLAHVLAVSGQNVMLLATLVLGLGALTGLAWRARLVAALALVALYVPLAGGGPSIQRAGVMGAAGLAAALAGTPASRWYALGLAAAVTLAINPLSAGDPGWQLSFAAVAALLVLAPPLRAALGRRVPIVVADATSITVAATVGTAPLMAVHFQQVSLVSLPANLVAAAAVAPVMWLGMLATAAAQLGTGLAVPFVVCTAPLLAFIAEVAHVAAGVPLAVATVQLGSPAAVALAYTVLGAVCLGLRAAAHRLCAGDRRALSRGERLRRRAGMAAAGLAAVGLAGAAHARGRPRPPAPGELVVSFLDVGQGDATLLQRDGASILMDTGPPEGPILRRLAAAGVERLDVLILSHAQSDHEGAALPVLARYRPRLVLDGGAGWVSAVQRGLPAAAARAGSRVLVPTAGERLDLGGLRVRVLWPRLTPSGPPAEVDPNELAVVALASAGDFDLLLTADAESDVTLPLPLPHVEALKVAHHGSADEGLPLLLRRLTPVIAAIEVGRHNTYGHPAPSTMAQLRTVAHVVRTDRDGTVRLHVRGDAMTLERLGAGR